MIQGLCGAGIWRTWVTPLLAKRIEKGITLLAENPDARLILSGGQGPGEEIPESEAMAAYTMDRGVDEEILVPAGICKRQRTPHGS